MPLTNLSGDLQQEYLADGMTDELITDLAKSSGLRVISRTSVMHYKRTTLPLSQIGKQLNVDAVVEGSVARSGERIRTTAQLLEISTDRHLWADSYERDMHDVLQLQDDLAQAIADQVEAKLPSPRQVRARAAWTLAWLRRTRRWRKSSTTTNGTGQQQRRNTDVQLSLIPMV